MHEPIERVIDRDPDDRGGSKGTFPWHGRYRAGAAGGPAFLYPSLLPLRSLALRGSTLSRCRHGNRKTSAAKSEAPSWPNAAVRRTSAALHTDT